MRTIIADIRNLLFPRYCTVCGEKLVQGETYLCTNCLRHMPKTHFDPLGLNPMMLRFVGELEVQHASSLFYYTHGDPYTRLIKEAKYHNLPQLSRHMGRMAANEWKESGFFKEIDSLVPVPLSRRRKWSRGFNQSEWIARGVADVTAIPLNTSCLFRTTHNKTQTHMNAYERWSNVQEIFTVRHPEQLTGRHILLIDDVFTTGATITSCVKTLTRDVPSLRISIMTLCTARDE